MRGRVAVVGAAMLACAAGVSHASPTRAGVDPRASTTSRQVRAVVDSTCPGFATTSPLQLAGTVTLHEVSWTDPAQPVPLTTVESELRASGVDGRHRYTLRGTYVFGPAYLDLVLGYGTTRVTRDDRARMIGTAALTVDPQSGRFRIAWADGGPTCYVTPLQTPPRRL